MSNNFARLKDEADIGEVVDYLGLHVTPKGSARFILCPNPAHDDTQIIVILKLDGIIYIARYVIKLYRQST